jgi:Flp pilus assembly protein TadG
MVKVPMLKAALTTMRHSSQKGQALAEFALILPILAALLGGAIDMSRVYEASLTVQSGTRNAAESAASSATDSASALTIARGIVCNEAQHLPGFVPGPGGNVATCTAPSVTITSFSRSSTAPGASAKYPIGSVTVHTSLAFQMLFHWPLLPNGNWTLEATQSYSVVQNR